MNWLKVLVGLSAIIVAGCAAYFSVTGLGVLFAGASTPVMIMASSLELAKVVAATYLKQQWNSIKGFNKWYLATSVFVLMLITSVGIFGYLSNAFQQQNLKLIEIDREIALFDTKIKQNDSEIERYNIQLSNQQTIRNSQEQNISKLVERSESTNRLTQMVKNSDKEIIAISEKINLLSEENNKNLQKINEIKNTNIETEREVGGFRFVADVFGIDLNDVVKYFIILIVIVFDPLAVALIIAFNGINSEPIIINNDIPTPTTKPIRRRKPKTKKDSEKVDIKIKRNSKKDDSNVYEIYGDTVSPIIDTMPVEPFPTDLESNSIEDIELPLSVDSIIDSGEFETDTTPVQDTVQDTVPVEELNDISDNIKSEEWLNPDFDWSNKQLWINNPKAVNFWVQNRGGSRRELGKIFKEWKNQTDT
jgi:hypothetical protein